MLMIINENTPLVQLIIQNNQMDMKQKVCEIKAPAKLILCGEHAVVYGEDAVAMSIGLYCNALLQKRKAETQYGRIVFKLQIEEQAIEIDWSLIQQFRQLYQKYGQKCNYELFKQEVSPAWSQKNHSYRTLHYKLGLFLVKKEVDWKSWSMHNHYDWFVTVKSTIPLGKGLGSSAAFNTVLSTALSFIFEKIQAEKTNSLNFQTKEMINSLAYLFECVEHGTPSGIDNFVSVHGGLIVFNKLKQPRFRLLKGAAEKLKNSLKLAIADSKVQKNTKVAVQKVREYCKSNEVYVNKIKEIGQISGKVIEMLSGQQELPKIQFFELVKTNHKLLSDFGLSHAEIQKLISIGEESGWVGKITGSGMGGCVLLVADFSQTNINEQFVLTEFDEKGLTVTVYSQN